MTKFLLMLAGLAITLAGCGGMAHDMSKMPGHGDTGMDHSSMQGAGALSSEMAGYRFAPASTTLLAGSAQIFTFQILNPEGRPQTQFAVDQTKQLHMYLVRRDLTSFQHLHPELASDGTWSIQLTVADPGSYRAIVDFIAIDARAAHKPLGMGTDLMASGDYHPIELGALSKTAAVDGYQVTMQGTPGAGMESRLKFSFSKGGAGATDLEPYLDTFGHLTSLRAGDLAYSHVHPVSAAAAGARGGPEVEFVSNFPGIGDYRLFLQFQTAGVLHTAVFTIHVS